MRTKTLLLASLLVLGAVAVAPTASADHIDCEPGILPPAFCAVVLTAGHPAETAGCLLTTGPVFWLSQCVPP